ncbi:MAG: hypothetical protein ACLFS8_07845 [Clostridia bacterium]
MKRDGMAIDIAIGHRSLPVPTAAANSGRWPDHENGVHEMGVRNCPKRL